MKNKIRVGNIFYAADPNCSYTHYELIKITDVRKCFTKLGDKKEKWIEVKYTTTSPCFRYHDNWERFDKLEIVSKEEAEFHNIKHQLDHLWEKVSEFDEIIRKYEAANIGLKLKLEPLKVERYCDWGETISKEELREKLDELKAEILEKQKNHKKKKGGK